MNEYKEAVLLDIIRDTYPELNIKSHLLHKWNGNNYVIEINNSIIFKIPITMKNQVALEREILIDDLLSKYLSVSVPKFELTKKYKDTKLVAGYRKIAGIPLTNQSYAGKKIGIELKSIRAKAQIYAQYSKLLTELHGLSIAEFLELGVPDEQRERWRDRYEMFYYKVHDTVYPYLKKAVKKKIEKLFEKFLEEQANFEFKAVLIHGDFGGWNILYDTQTKKITGVLDWENAVIGDPALDFAELLYDYGPEFTDKVLKHYKLDIDPQFSERGKFYRSLAGLIDIIDGSENGDTEILNRGLEYISIDFK
jgi:aminoglycoside 2''-phosphotransferase